MLHSARPKNYAFLDLQFVHLVVLLRRWFLGVRGHLAPRPVLAIPRVPAPPTCRGLRWVRGSLQGRARPGSPGDLAAHRPRLHLEILGVQRVLQHNIVSFMAKKTRAVQNGKLLDSNWINIQMFNVPLVHLEDQDLKLEKKIVDMKIVDISCGSKCRSLSQIRLTEQSRSRSAVLVLIRFNIKDICL